MRLQMTETGGEDDARASCAGIISSSSRQSWQTQVREGSSGEEEHVIKGRTSGTKAIAREARERRKEEAEQSRGSTIDRTEACACQSAGIFP